MRRPDLDWGILGGATATLVVTALVVGGLVFASSAFERSAQEAFEKDQRRFNSASSRYLAVDEEERLAREYLPVYRSLEADGLIGPEDRLNWTETLTEVAEELEIPSMRYQIQPREAYTPPVPVRAGPFRVYASTMRLSAGLVHEEDLLRLLEALERRAAGSFNVESCTIRRGRAGELAPFRENLQADCSLQWFTVRKPEPGEGRR